MNNEYYISTWRMNHRISETVVDGYPIKVEGIIYEKVSKAPAGRRVIRRLLNTNTNTRIKIYG